MFLIVECTELALDGQPFDIRSLYMTDDLAIDVELLGDSNHFVGGLFVGVDFQAVAHVKHLVHLVPVSARGGLDHLEQRR